MAYFEWVDDLCIDNGPIDADHRRLVDLVNALHTSAIEGHSRVAVGEHMATLIFYTQDHLLREEEIMAAVAFPELEHHKQSHVRFLAELHEFQRDFNSGNTTTATHLAEILKIWLTTHVLEADSELRHHLKNMEQAGFEMTVTPVQANQR